jgi:phenylpyruvate tautomerase PptA (4-oxalocrotonate tautomerase family)
MDREVQRQVEYYRMDVDDGSEGEEVHNPEVVPRRHFEAAPIIPGTQPPPPPPAPQVVHVVHHPPPDLFHTFHGIRVGMHHMAQEYRDAQNRAMLADQQRVALSIAREAENQRRHEQLMGMMQQLGNQGLTVHQQFVTHVNHWNQQTLLQQVFYSGHGAIDPEDEDLEMTLSVPKRPGDDRGGGGKRIKALPADALAQETVNHIVQMASAAAAAPPSAAPPLVTVTPEEMAAYSVAHNRVAARQAKRDLLAESVAAVAKMPRKTPSKVAVMIEDADEANDQSGSRPLRRITFAKGEAKAYAKRSKTPKTPKAPRTMLALSAPPTKPALPAPPAMLALPAPEKARGVRRTVDKTIKLTPGRRAVK